jgi:hypothetical protein
MAFPVTAIACFQGFLCVSAKIRRRRICHSLFEGDERQSLSRAPQTANGKGSKPLALTQRGFPGFGWKIYRFLTAEYH